MNKDELDELAEDLGRSIARKNRHHVVPFAGEHAVARADSPGEALLFLDRARLALDAALDFQAVRECRDMSVALAAYAREARDGSLMDKAARLRVEAERRAGAMLKETRPFKPAGWGEAPRMKLSDIGITAVQSSVWQQLATLPDEVYKDALAQAAAPGKLLTSPKVLAAARAISPPTPRQTLTGAPSHRNRTKSALIDAVRELLEVLGTRTRLMAEEKAELMRLYEAIEVVLVEGKA